MEIVLAEIEYALVPVFIPAFIIEELDDILLFLRFVFALSVPPPAFRVPLYPHSEVHR
jgi:hypothetical protein